MSTLVIGHKNPDTDSICSAIGAADLMAKRGMSTQAVAQGDPTPETRFILDKFGLQVPKVRHSVAGHKVILVDHSDLNQAPDDIDEAQLVAVIDHHKLGDVTTDSPLLMWVWPVGCSCTIIKEMYDYYGIEIPKSIAGALLGAILSDTVIFKSPTTTEEDKKAVQDLARTAGVKDYRAFGMEIFKIKSDIDGIPAQKLLFRDFKDFTMSGHKVGIGQIEIIDIKMLDKVKSELKAELKKAKEDGRDAALLLLTDIMQEGSELLIASDTPEVICKAFKKNPAESLWLPHVISRKKDVIPALENAFKS